jgi:hypothetical protein
MGHSYNATEFVLFGLTQGSDVQEALFIMVLHIYIVTMMGNLLIMVTVLASPSLESSMYFFLKYLPVMDAAYSMAISPKVIIDLLYDKKNLLPSQSAWGSSLFSTFLVVLKSSFRWRWPMIAMYPFVSHCTI